MKRVGIYARVSTLDQSTENQLLDLRRYVDARGWQGFKEYCDNGTSGTKTSRPALNEMMDDARKRRFDVVLVWRFDRFARSTKQLILALEEFRNLGIDFVSYQENIDTSSPVGQVIFTIMSAMAQFESNLIRERTRCGIRRARKKGRKLGRPRIEIDVATALELRKRGWSFRRIAKEMGVNATSLHRYLKAVA